MEYRVDFDSLPWESPMKGVRAKIAQHGGRRLRLVEYTKAMPPHWCDAGHVGYLLDGRFEIEFDNGVRVYGPGDGIFIPPGSEHRHRAKALTEVVRVVFVEDV